MREHLQGLPEFQPIAEHTFNHRGLVVNGGTDEKTSKKIFSLLAEIHEKTSGQIPIIYIDPLNQDSIPIGTQTHIRTTLEAWQSFIRDQFVQTAQGLCIKRGSNEAICAIGEQIAQLTNCKLHEVANLDGGNIVASNRGLFCVGSPAKLPGAMEFTQLDSSSYSKEPTLYHADLAVGFLWDRTKNKEFAVVASTQEALNLSNSNTGNPYIVKHGWNVFFNQKYTEMLLQFEREVLTTLKRAGYTSDDIIHVPALLYPTNRTYKGDSATTLLYSPANLLQVNTPQQQFALLTGGIQPIDDMPYKE